MINQSRKPMVDRFKDKVCIVTGGSAGIGNAIVQEFVKEGGKVFFSCLPNDGQDAERELLDAGYDVSCQYGDMLDESFCKSLVESTYEKYGRIDYLVNNAFSFIAKWEDAERSDWDRVMQTGPIAFGHMTQFAAQYMKENGGAIVNMSSVSAHIAQVKRWTYNAAKGAVDMLTKCSALDLSEFGIRVNSISPAWIRTREISKGFGCEADEYDNIIGDYHMLRRSGSPHECAAAVLFLLSDDASFITGADIRVDGGYTAMGPEGLGKSINWAGSK